MAALGVAPSPQVTTRRGGAEASRDPHRTPSAMSMTTRVMVLGCRPMRTCRMGPDSNNSVASFSASVARVFDRSKKIRFGLYRRSSRYCTGPSSSISITPPVAVARRRTSRRSTVSFGAAAAASAGRAAGVGAARAMMRAASARALGTSGLPGYSEVSDISNWSAAARSRSSPWRTKVSADNCAASQSALSQYPLVGYRSTTCR